jgi:hypothetical protein
MVFAFFKNKKKEIFSIGPVEVELSPIAWDGMADNMKGKNSIKILGSRLKINNVDSGQDIDIILRKKED